MNGPYTVEGTTAGTAKAHLSSTKFIQSKRHAKSKEKVIVESSNDQNLEMALALSASLALASKEEASIIDDRTVNRNHNKELGVTKSTEPEDDVCTNLKGDREIPSVPDVIMASASSWWKKPLSPVSKKNGVPKRTWNNKGAKTILQTTTDTERNRQISDRVAHILAESGR